MIKRFVILSILTTSWTFAGAASDVRPLLLKADGIYAQRTVLQGADKALVVYEQALAEDPLSVEAAWKAARACYWLGDHATTRDEKIKWFSQGIELAKKGMALEPHSVDSHFWLGGLYGSYGEAKGILKSLFLVRPIRNEMQVVNELDEKYQGGGGYRILGIVDTKVPGFAGGSKTRALEHFNKALELGPQNAFNHYYIAEYYKIIGNRDKAQEHLQILEALSSSPDMDGADLEMIKEKGRELLKSF